MTDTPKPGLEIQEQIARINRDLAHERNLDSDTRWKPWQVMAIAMSGIGGLIGALAGVLGFILGRISHG